MGSSLVFQGDKSLVPELSASKVVLTERHFFDLVPEKIYINCHRLFSCHKLGNVFDIKFVTYLLGMTHQHFDKGVMCFLSTLLLILSVDND